MNTNDFDIVNFDKPTYYLHLTEISSATAKFGICLKSYREDILKEIREKEKNKILTSANAQKIILSACKKWQNRLVSLWSSKIALSEDIHISEDFYKEMRNACTESQHKLFDEIFGEEKKIFTTLDLEIGDYLLVDDETYPELKYYNYSKDVYYTIENGYDSNFYRSLQLILTSDENFVPGDYLFNTLNSTIIQYLNESFVNENRKYLQLIVASTDEKLTPNKIISQKSLLKYLEDLNDKNSFLRIGYENVKDKESEIFLTYTKITQEVIRKEVVRFLERISETVGETITEYHWREAQELLLLLKS